MPRRKNAATDGLIPMETGQDIKQLLDDIGWDAVRLAYELRVSYHTVQGWISGRRRIPEPMKILLRAIRWNWDHLGVKGLNLPKEVVGSK